MDWVLFFLSAFGIILFLMVFIPGILAFFSLRQTLCSLIAWIAVLAFSELGLTKLVVLSDALFSDSDKKILIPLYGLVVCYSLSWMVMHFILPKTLFSKVSKKGKVVVGIITLLVIASLIVFFCYSYYSPRWAMG